MNEQEILDMYGKLENARIAQINQQRTDMINGLNKQKSEKTNDFYNDRNSVDVANSQNVNGIRERMASMGNLNGGANIQAQLSANTDRMNRLGQLGHEESYYNSGMNDKINSTNTNFNNEINSTTADYDSKKMTAIDQYRQQQAQIARQQALAQQQQQRRSATTAQPQNTTALAWQTLKQQLSNGGYGAAINWAQSNQRSLVSSIGKDEYAKMRDSLYQVQNQIRGNEAYDRNSRPW